MNCADCGLPVIEVFVDPPYFALGNNKSGVVVGFCQNSRCAGATHAVTQQPTPQTWGMWFMLDFGVRRT
jgi:hypothetical protein